MDRELNTSKARCGSTAFQYWHISGSRTAASPKLFAFREAGMQVSPVTMSCPFLRTAAPPCLLFIKEPKGGRGAIAFCSLPLAFTLGFCLWLWLGFFALAFGLFGVGSFWKEKGLLKGKELLKGSC
jgi:hypothetical protein